MRKHKLASQNMQEMNSDWNRSYSPNMNIKNVQDKPLQNLPGDEHLRTTHGEHSPVKLDIKTPTKDS